MEPKCDFCNVRLVFGSSWRFQCDDFSIKKSDGRIQEYVEDWSACPVCKDLIVAGKRDKLAQRAARAVLQSAPLGTPFASVEKSAREIQDGFGATAPALRGSTRKRSSTRRSRELGTKTTDALRGS